MTRIEELAAVVWLACETGDRTGPEHRALVATAKRVDHDWNTQTSTNPLLDHAAPAGPCDYPGVHDRTCPCHGDTLGVRRPRGGWSRLEQHAETTREET